LGERIINEESGTPPSKNPLPYYPVIPYYPTPYPFYPQYPIITWMDTIAHTSDYTFNPKLTLTSD